MKQPLHLLMVEDSEDDALLLTRQLQHGNFEVQYERVETAETFVSALESHNWDIILCDYTLPKFNGLKALSIIKERAIDIPFIFVSGTMGEERAVEAMQAGAHDYVMKQDLKRLIPAIERELREAEVRKERVHAEEKIAFQAAILEQVPSATIATDIDGTIFYWNKFAETLYGWKSEEVLGKNIMDIIIPNDSASWAKEIVNRVDQIGHTDNEMEFKRKDGTTIPVHVSSSILRDVSGKAVGRLGVSTDITERKRAVEKLRESESMLRAMFESSRDAIGVSKRGKHIYANSAYFELFGFENNEQFVGTSILNSIAPSHHQQIMQNIERRFAGKPATNFYETRGMKVDGTEFDAEVNVSTYELDGEIYSVAFLRDITDRKREEAALRESEERFRMIFENVHDGISIYAEDPDPIKRRLIECNERYAAMAGRSHEELLNLGFTRTLQVPAVDDEKNSEVWYNSRQTPFQGVFSWIRPDGKNNSIEFIAVPITWRGKPHTISIDRDITERTKIEEALIHERNLLNALLDSIPDHLYFKDRGSRFLRISRAQARDFGFDDPEQSVGKTDFDFFEEEHARSAFEDEQKIMKSGIAVVDLEEKESWPDGRQTWVSTTKVPLRNAQGEIIGTFGISRDITNRKQAEEERQRLMTAFEQTVEAILITDPQGIIQYVNPAFERITGFARKEIIGQNPRIMNSGRQNAVFYEKLWKTISTGGKWNGRFVNKRKDGTLFTDETSISPVLNEKGEIINYVGVKRDITSELSLESQLIQAQRLESVGTLASGIAHDFNNILGIIMGHTSLLERLREDSNKYSESIAAISKATQRGASLVKQLMLFARKTEPLLESVKINVIIGEITKLLRDTFPKTITISTSFQQELPAIIADSSQIHQVLLNLLVNARDAMPTGGMISITTMTIGGETVISRFPKAAARQYVKVEVADAGMGMDEATRQRIFEPFFTTKSPGKGTGLGLAVVFGIVEHHNGFIDVRSAPGEGTSFTVYLPIPERAVEEMQVAQKGLEEIPGGTETILLIEDEEVLRTLAKGILVLKGYTVLTAEDGMQGIEMYRSHQKEIAVVLSDIGLPILGGHDVFRKIRAINPEAKVIFASGFFDPETKSEMFKAGLKNFIQKPYMQDEVLQKIREAIDSK